MKYERTTINHIPRDRRQPTGYRQQATNRFLRGGENRLAVNKDSLVLPASIPSALTLHRNLRGTRHDVVAHSSRRSSHTAYTECIIDIILHTHTHTHTLTQISEVRGIPYQRPSSGTTVQFHGGKERLTSLQMRHDHLGWKD